MLGRMIDEMHRSSIIRLRTLSKP